MRFSSSLKAGQCLDREISDIINARLSDLVIEEVSKRPNPVGEVHGLPEDMKARFIQCLLHQGLCLDPRSIPLEQFSNIEQRVIHKLDMANHIEKLDDFLSKEARDSIRSDGSVLEEIEAKTEEMILQWIDETHKGKN